MTKTNRYYENTFAPVMGSSIKSAAQKSQFDAVQAGFDQIQLEINANGGGGVDGMSILDLGGMPASFVGAGLKHLRVNAAESAIEFTHHIPVVSVTSSRDLQVSDVGCMLACNSATDMTLTVQPYSSVPIEAECPILVAQIGAGKVTIAAGAGVTLLSSSNLYSTNGTGAQITLLMVSSNTVLIGGDRAA